MLRGPVPTVVVTGLVCPTTVCSRPSLSCWSYEREGGWPFPASLRNGSVPWGHDGSSLTPSPGSDRLCSSVGDGTFWPFPRLYQRGNMKRDAPPPFHLHPEPPLTPHQTHRLTLRLSTCPRKDKPGLSEQSVGLLESEPQRKPRRPLHVPQGAPV